MNKLSTEEQQVLYLIKTDADQARYFFARAKSLKWFLPLRDEGYFKPETISYDANGYALFWSVLDYLERVSEQTAQNTQYGKELIEIIESLVQFSFNKKQINNYHIWWYCVKITNNLPSAVIKENLKIEQFRRWLSVWTDHSMGVDLTISDIGEKLLPKFLHDDFGPDFKYAETIVDVITQIKPGGNAHGITQREDAVLAWDSYWIRDAFNKHGRLVGQKCSLNVLYALADRLNDALKFKQKNYYANIDIGDAVYQIWVSRIETGANIGFKENAYKCIVKQYSNEQLQNIDRQNDFWTLHNASPATELESFEFSASNAEQLTKAVRSNLPEGIEWEKGERFQERLVGIFKGLHSDYSQIWFKSITSGGLGHGSGAEEILTTILRDVLIAKCETNRHEGSKVLESFLTEKYLFPIYRRFVLLCVDKFLSDYAILLDKFFEIIPDALEEPDFEVELQDVLLHHNSAFSAEFKKRLQALIDKVPVYYVEKGEKTAAYWKFKWLSPLRKNSDFSQDYEEAKQKANPKDGKPYEPERSTFQGGAVWHKSPMPKEDILKKTVVDLVKYLNEFEGADFWRGTFEGEPDKEGLAETVQVSVKDAPEKFTDELDVFLDVNYFYLHRIFRGLKDAWNSGKEIDWKSIFSFCEKYLSQGADAILQKAKQAQGEDSGKGKYIWIVEGIVDLIEDGCKDDKRAFAPEHFGTVEKIFDLILPLLKGASQPDTQRDALTYALNTTVGRTIMAYVSFSLRVARVAQKPPVNWGPNMYERFIAKGIEAYIWFGCYLPQMNYLDKDYTKGKIECFTSKPSDDFEWRMFMEGYLTGARVYNDLYRVMRENYAKGLSGKVLEERVDQRLVEHICIGYLHLGELLAEKNVDGENSLFWKLLTEAGALGKYDRWLEVAGFFWSITGRSIRNEDQEKEEKLSEENKKKISEFWAWTFNHPDVAKANLGDEYNSFLGRMAELTIILDKIDEEKEKWLMLSAPFIELQHRSTFFIEYLTKFEDKESIERIGRIFKKVLENTTPTFRQEDIESIVRRVYDKGNREDAEAICNTYGRRGVHFLKPIWEENQGKK